MKAGIKGVCMYADCEKQATVTVFHREMRILIALCEDHANIVVERDDPEYVVDCPNCKCRFGVN